jgi:hypothetical protein
MPFPLFFFQHPLRPPRKTHRPDATVYPPPAPETLVPACPNPSYVVGDDPPVSLNDLIIGESSPVAEAAVPVGVAEVPTNVVPPEPPRKPPPEPPKPPKPTASAGNARLIAARANAARQIKAYRDALKSKKPKNPIPFHGHAFQFASSTKPSVYNRPRPELVQPRLARLIL